MTSLKQIEANRRNAQKSTGPATAEGKQRSRCNALRHGLTAETVIGVLESREDYNAFEEAIIAEYDPKSVIERELVARLVSLLWRLRRATAIETGLFEMQADPLARFRGLLKMAKPTDASSSLERAAVADDGNGRIELNSVAPAAQTNTKNIGSTSGPSLSLTQCFLRLVNSPNFMLDRLSRYEASLWRQAEQIMLALDNWARSRR